jgi:restriction endonuclease
VSTEGRIEVKRISTEAYQALREALAVIIWNKRPFESYLRTALREAPDLLAGLPFAEPKRVVADMLVDRLVEKEQKYQQLTLTLMLEVASLSTFPNIEQIKDPEDRQLRLEDARRAVARLKKLTEIYADQVSGKERVEADQEARRAQDEAQRKFADEVEALRIRFLHLQTNEPDRQKRGKGLERLLTDFFALFDMEPRLAYSLEREEIDGSLSFDTDDYIVEARWRDKPTSRADVDIFATKVRRKGKNALGLFISVEGFTRDALEQYGESTPFMVVDGADLYLALDQRVRLDDLIKAKKRHANETGDCYLAGSALV